MQWNTWAGDNQSSTHHAVLFFDDAVLMGTLFKPQLSFSHHGPLIAGSCSLLSWYTLLWIISQELLFIPDADLLGLFILADYCQVGDDGAGSANSPIHEKLSISLID